jgi:DNA-binding transcriptional LysR family regulator
LQQAGPNEIVKMLLNGEADIGVATEVLSDVTKLDSFPYYSWYHAVIVPVGHPLEKVQPLTLQALAEYPLVTYHEGLTGRAKLDKSFADAGIKPDIVMSALDADVIKTYVELGMGIGIICLHGLQSGQGFRPSPVEMRAPVRCEYNVHRPAARSLFAQLCLSLYRALFAKAG